MRFNLRNQVSAHKLHFTQDFLEAFMKEYNMYTLNSTIFKHFLAFEQIKCPCFSNFTQGSNPL